LLGAFPEYVAFRAIRHEEHEGVGTSVVSTDVAPSEATGALVEDSNATLAADLLERVLAQPPVFLETLALKLLAAMGYRGRESLLEHTGQPGDAGLDGLVRQDALGLDLLGCRQRGATRTTRFNAPRCKDSSEHCRAPKPTGAYS
jgi:restriction system protein